MTPTAALNISRVLHHLGLGKSVVITEAHEDRVFAWPVDDSLMRHVVLHEWPASMGPRSIDRGICTGHRPSPRGS